MTVLRVALPCLFLSGACALVYENVWIRQVSYVFGSTVVASTLVLTAYMAGLALGSAAAGPVADRLRRPLKVYGWLELGITVSALAFDPVLATVKELYLRALEHTALPAFAMRGLEFMALLAVLLVPTALMGATLPVLCSAGSAAPAEHRAGWTMGLLYATNSLGAVSGSLAAGFVLIERFGLSDSTYLAAVVNALVGVAALVADLVALALGAVAADRDRPPLPGPGPGEATAAAAARRWAVLPIIFVSGFTAMLYEVALMKLLPLILGSSIHAFALMVSAFISGIAIGSGVVTRLLPRMRDPLRCLGLLHGVVAVMFLASVPLYNRLPVAYLAFRLYVNVSFGTFQVFSFGLCFLTMTLPAVFVGAMLPVAVEAAARAEPASGRGIGAAVGRIYSVSTAGNILGTAITGLALVPWLGFKGSVEVGVVANAGIAVAVAAMDRGIPGRLPWPVAAAPVLVALALYGVAAPRLDVLALTGAIFRIRERPPSGSADLLELLRRGRQLMFIEEDGQALVSVDRWEHNGTLSLRVNGKVDASDRGDMLTQRLVAHLPLLAHPGPRTTAVVGFGSGVTIASALAHPLERLDCVEISPAVVRASRLFRAVNGGVESDPRLNLVIDDARSFFERSRATYDVIISEPSNPWFAGVSSLYTREFFLTLRHHLSSSGVVAQFVQTYEMDTDTLRLILRTFRKAFPHATVMHGSAYDLVVLGSERPIDLGCERIGRRMELPSVKRDLASVGVDSALILAGHQIVAAEDFDLVCGSGPINTDDWPVLEYRAPRALFNRERAELPDWRFRLSPHHWIKRCTGGIRPGAAQLLALARHFHKEYRADLISTLLSEVLGQDPGNVEARLMLADVLRTAGELRGALAIAEEGARREPRSVAIQALRCDLALEVEGQETSPFGTRAFPRALAAARTCVAIAPERWYVHSRLGSVHYNRGEWREAERACTKAIELARARGRTGPQPTWAHLEATVASCRLKLGDLEGAAAQIAGWRGPRAEAWATLTGEQLEFCSKVAAAVDEALRRRAR
jgi:predicted membrane-bound spermidine synthase